MSNPPRDKAIEVIARAVYAHEWGDMQTWEQETKSGHEYWITSSTHALDALLTLLKAEGLRVLPDGRSTTPNAMRIAGMNSLLPKSMDFADHCYERMTAAFPDPLKDAPDAE